MRQLYRVLSPSAHVLLSFCVEYVLLTFSTVFYACTGYSMSRAHFHSGLVPKDNVDHRCQLQTLLGGPRQF